MKIQQKKLSHGGLKSPEKQKQGANAVGSGDWLGGVVEEFNMKKLCSFAKELGYSE